MKISRELYADYLRSQEWAARREKVMQRAVGLCEGCRVKSASDVHHLSYEHVTEEFLFELVALCGDCHARIHGVTSKRTTPNWTPRNAAQAAERRLLNRAAEARAKLMATPPKPPPPMDERMATLARKFHRGEAGDEFVARPKKNGEVA